jgi:carbonic anhydrase-like protein
MSRFDPSHPTTLAIYCSDGRFTHVVEDHCEDLGHERIDTMTLPGGPALLTSGPANLSEVHVFSGAAQFLIEAHGIKHVFLFAHAGCGFYRARCSRLPDEAVRRMQIENLRAARASLRRQFPKLAVTCSYVATDGETVTFTDVTGG